jgi:hypothetical protein
MASLIKQDGLYYLQFFDSGRSPRRKRVPLKTRTRRIAERLKLQYEDAFAGGELDPWVVAGPEENERETGPIELQEAIDGFLLDKSHLRPESIKKYRCYLMDFGRCASEPLLERLSSAHVQRWLRSRDVLSG